MDPLYKHRVTFFCHVEAFKIYRSVLIIRKLFGRLCKYDVLIRMRRVVPICSAHNRDVRPGNQCQKVLVNIMTVASRRYHG